MTTLPTSSSRERERCVGSGVYRKKISTSCVYTAASRYQVRPSGSYGVKSSTRSWRSGASSKGKHATTSTSRTRRGCPCRAGSPYHKHTCAGARTLSRGAQSRRAGRPRRTRSRDELNFMNPESMRSAPTIEWSKANFAIREALAQRRGPFVELAGPTHRGYQMIPSDFFDRERERIFVSNITTNPPQGGEVQLAADAGQLPFADESLGAVLACELPRFVREPAITEASRALEEGGLLIWQGVLFEDIAFARNHGLELVAYTWRLPSKVATALRTADRSDIGSLHAAAIELIKKLEADDM